VRRELINRIKKIEEAASEEELTFKLTDGTTVRTTNDKILELYLKLLDYAREGELPQDELLQQLMEADPETLDNLAGVIRSVGLSIRDR